MSTLPAYGLSIATPRLAKRNAPTCERPVAANATGPVTHNDGEVSVRHFVVDSVAETRSECSRARFSASHFRAEGVFTAGVHLGHDRPVKRQ